ncbi:glycosyltransferase family 2 protein [Candidatus Latescibacterota bacterium]
MYRDKSIGVIVPAYNEEQLIRKTLTTMPDFVDRVFVVDDGSEDRTAELIKAHMVQDSRVSLIEHEANQGLGQSLIDGYVASRDADMDVTAVMAGDAQMDPTDLAAVVEPVAEGWADYVKGNRLLRDDVVSRMPRHRYLGNAVLTLLNKFATGYWSIIDPQCGYTAIGREALEAIPIETLTKGYGYNAHILNMLNLNNFSVCDVEVRPVYGEERSGIRLSTYIPRVVRLLLRLFLRRMVHKYLVRDFNPLVFFYLFCFANFALVGTPLFCYFIYAFFVEGRDPSTVPVILTYSLSMGFLSFFFAMWMDMEDNKRLVARKG